ncbi:Immunoglobulin V-set domain [Trinorchestia longiramus]|nr:Immunoglobulin V-set domain [Trinorchestia longiramus]
MRQHDLHILTAGSLTFSADERFRVLHPEDSDDWTLHIKVVTPKDAGLYECQVNSDPKISREVTLKVKEHSQLDDPGTFLQTTDARLPDYQVLPEYDSDFRLRSDGKRAKGRTRFRQCRERTKKRRSSGRNLMPLELLFLFAFLVA